MARNRAELSVECAELASERGEAPSPAPRCHGHHRPRPLYVEVLEFFGMGLDSLFAIKSKQAWFEFERGELDEAGLVDRYFSDGRKLDLAGLRVCMLDAYRFLPGVEGLLDRAKNCDAAEAVGKPALRFVDAASLREELRARGVLR